MGTPKASMLVNKVCKLKDIYFFYKLNSLDSQHKDNNLIKSCKFFCNRFSQLITINLL